jgi:hypothetical protein
MADLWPWLAVAGLGALHGLSPANGWMFAAAWGVHARDAGPARRALLPIAIGHAASVAVVACVIALGYAVDRASFQQLAGALLVGAATYRWLRGARPCTPISSEWSTRRHESTTPPAGRVLSRLGPARHSVAAHHTGIALWSFLMATAHGAGLMLVPALVPLCLADSPAREITASGSLLLALAAVGVHTTAMLVTTGVIATGICRGISMHPRLLQGTASRQAWTAALGVTGVLLMALR